MTIELNEGTPFLADITATRGNGRYRLVVAGDEASSPALYIEAKDNFGQPYWLDASRTSHYLRTVGEIIVALVRQGSEFEGK